MIKCRHFSHFDTLRPFERTRKTLGFHSGWDGAVGRGGSSRAGGGTGAVERGEGGGREEGESFSRFFFFGAMASRHAGHGLLAGVLRGLLRLTEGFIREEQAKVVAEMPLA